MKITNYTQALDYLEGFIGKVMFKLDKEFLRKHDPLERMRIFLSLLGNPEQKFKSVLVGGTSGKGSTAYLISHILTISGYKTGFTVSPHLQKVNERIQINGESINDQQFTDLLVSILSSIEGMKKMKVGGPSYFEILIGMAFQYFANQKVDIAIVEVGMGGEFDATNTLNPLIAVLTNVGLDHTHVLGNTVEKIAKTKAGIIKKNYELRIKDQGEENYSSIIHDSSFMIQPIVVTGVKQSSVIEIVEKKCEDTRATLNLLWKNFGYKIKKESQSGIKFDFISHEKTLEDLELSLLGQYQAENVSLGIKTILELEKFGLKISENAIRKALKTAFFPGRFEVQELKIKNLKLKIILDGAHNPTKMKEFLKSLKKLYSKERKIFIIGFKFDKDISKMLKQIIKVADEIIVTQFKAKTDVAVHTSAEASGIKDELLRMNYQGKISVEKDSEKALKKALQIALKTIQQSNNSTIVVVTGSLYLVGEIRNKLC